MARAEGRSSSGIDVPSKRRVSSFGRSSSVVLPTTPKISRAALLSTSTCPLVSSTMTPSVRLPEQRAELCGLALGLVRVLVLADARDHDALVDGPLVAGALLEGEALDRLRRDVLHDHDQPARAAIVVRSRPRRAAQIADAVVGQRSLVIDRGRSQSGREDAVEHFGRARAAVAEDGREGTANHAALVLPGDRDERRVRELDDVLAPARERDPERGRLHGPPEDVGGQERPRSRMRRHHALAFRSGH